MTNQNNNQRTLGRIERDYIIRHLMRETPPLTIKDSSGRILFTLNRYSVVDNAVRILESGGQTGFTADNMPEKSEQASVEFSIKDVDLYFYSSFTRLDNEIFLPIPTGVYKAAANGVYDAEFVIEITIQNERAAVYAHSDCAVTRDLTPQDFAAKARKIINFNNIDSLRNGDNGIAPQIQYDLLYAILPKSIGLARLLAIPGLAGSAVIKFKRRTVIARCACRAEPDLAQRSAAVFALRYTHPEDARFVYEYLYRDKCPDNFMDTIINAL